MLKKWAKNHVEGEHGCVRQELLPHSPFTDLHSSEGAGGGGLHH